MLGLKYDRWFSLYTELRLYCVMPVELSPNSFRVVLIGKPFDMASQYYNCSFDYSCEDVDSPIVSDANCTDLATSVFSSAFADAFMDCLGAQVTLDGTQVYATGPLGEEYFGYFDSSVSRHGSLIAIPMTSYGDCALIYRYAAVHDRRGRGRVRVPYAYVDGYDNRLHPDNLAALAVFASAMAVPYVISSVTFYPVLTHRGLSTTSRIETFGVRSRAYHLRTRIRNRT